MTTTKLETAKEDEFCIELIVNYLINHKSGLEKSWNEMKGEINFDRLPKQIDRTELESLNRFDQEIKLKKIICEKLNVEIEQNSQSNLYRELCLWIIKDWGGITSSNDDDTMKLVDDFLYRETKFNRIASTSKVASFLRPTEDVIYDSRVAYSLNWIILSTKAGNKYFPIPEGRNSKMMAFDLNVLIRLKNINKYQPTENNSLNHKFFIKNIDKKMFINEKNAYSELKKIIRTINNELWKGDKEKEENMYYTEMLLFAMADKEIYQDITSRVRIEI